MRLFNSQQMILSFACEAFRHSLFVRATCRKSQGRSLFSLHINMQSDALANHSTRGHWIKMMWWDRCYSNGVEDDGKFKGRLLKICPATVSEDQNKCLCRFHIKSLHSQLAPRGCQMLVLPPHWKKKSVKAEMWLWLPRHLQVDVWAPADVPCVMNMTVMAPVLQLSCLSWCN